jgi:Flp pilus assembly protein TadG
MKSSRARIWLRSARNARGAEIAETALILPLLFMMILAIFWFGQAFRIYGTITQAARQGARAAVAPPCATCASADPSLNAYNAINSALLAANLDPTQLQQPTTLPAVCACGSGTTSCSPSPVACDGSYLTVCIQGIAHPTKTTVLEQNVNLSSVGQGGAGECGVSVSFQYPFSLSLPFSSLNQQVVLLRAQAEMRAEGQ